MCRRLAREYRSGSRTVYNIAVYRTGLTALDASKEKGRFCGIIIIIIIIIIYFSFKI